MKRLVALLTILSASEALWAQAQRSYAWQNHPVARQLYDATTGVWPEIPGVGTLALLLVSAAVFLWVFYFRACWREAWLDERSRMLNGPTPEDTPVRSLRLAVPGGNPEGIARARLHAETGRPHLRAAKGKTGPKKSPERGHDEGRGK